MNQDDSVEFLRRIVAYVGEIEIACYQGESPILCDASNYRVRGASQVFISHIQSFMSQVTELPRDRARQTGVHEKFHHWLAAGQRMVLFLIDQFTRKSQRRANIFGREVVLVLDLGKGHAGCEATNDNRYGRACAADNGLAMANPRVDLYAFVHT